MKKFFKDTSLYLVGDIFNKLAVFLLIPFYTNYFSVEEYGVLEQILIAIGITNILVSLSSKTAFLRLYFNYDEEKVKEFLFNIIVLITSISLFLFLFIVLFDVFNDNIYVTYSYFILGYVFLLSLNELSLTLLRVKKKIFNYSMFTLLKTILELSLIILFVKYFDHGIIGKLEGSLLSMLLLFIVIFKILIWKNITITINFDYIKEYINYSYPLVVYGIIGWVLISYDKIIINNNFITKDLGIFALGMQIIMIYKYIAESSLKAFNVEVFSKPKIIESYFYEIIILILSIFIVFSLLLSFFIDDLIIVISNINYIEAATVFKYMIISRVLMIYNILMVMVLFVYNDTKAVSKTTYIGLVATLISATILIPYLHFLGAGISSIIVFGIIGYFLTKKVKEYVDFTFDYKIILLGLLLLFGVFLSFFDMLIIYKLTLMGFVLFFVAILNYKFISLKILKKGIQ